MHRLPMYVVFAILGAYALAATLAISTHWYFEDAGAYWEAALRLRAGEPLYVDHLIDPELYRYAPWFAFAWVPLTFLPEPLVMAAWAGVLLVAAGWLVWPDWRNPVHVALSLLIYPDLLRVTSTGNVQPLLLALIAATLLTRWGPWVLGITASLKVFPLAFALYYGRRWSRYAIAFGTAGVLIAPMLLFDLSGYPPRDLISPGMLSILLVVAKVSRRTPSRTGTVAYRPQPLTPSIP